jgi:hypothetical protein
MAFSATLERGLPVDLVCRVGGRRFVFKVATLAIRNGRSGLQWRAKTKKHRAMKTLSRGFFKNSAHASHAYIAKDRRDSPPDRGGKLRPLR